MTLCSNGPHLHTACGRYGPETRCHSNGSDSRHRHRAQIVQSYSPDGAHMYRCLTHAPMRHLDWFVQPFLHVSRSRPTDRRTDRQTDTIRQHICSNDRRLSGSSVVSVDSHVSSMFFSSTKHKTVGRADASRRPKSLVPVCGGSSAISAYSDLQSVHRTRLIQSSLCTSCGVFVSPV